MQNGEWRMKNGAAKAKFEIVFLKWELLLIVPFCISHSPFLTLGAFVSSWQKQREKYGLGASRVDRQYARRIV